MACDEFSNGFIIWALKIRKSSLASSQLEIDLRTGLRIQS
jgi:hypothetical protein